MLTSSGASSTMSLPQAITARISRNHCSWSSRPRKLGHAPVGAFVEKRSTSPSAGAPSTSVSAERPHSFRSAAERISARSTITKATSTRRILACSTCCSDKAPSTSPPSPTVVLSSEASR
jgi:hypothetical protein